MKYVKSPYRILNEDNRPYVKDRTSHLHSENEAIQNLRYQRQKIGFMNVTGTNTILILIGLFVWFSFIFGGLFTLYVGIMATITLIIAGKFLLLVGSVGLIVIGLAGLYHIGRPMLIGAFEIFKYLFACTSLKRLFKYLVKKGNLVQRQVKSVSISDGKTDIEYSFSPVNNQSISPEDIQRRKHHHYITSVDIDIDVDCVVYVIYAGEFSFLL